MDQHNGPLAHQCQSDMLGLPASRRQPARMRDSFQTALPDGPGSDGFVLNCLEEGALGDPVLAGNPITSMGAGYTADPPVASERQGAEEAGLRGGSAARNPDEQTDPTTLMQHRPARWFLFWPF